MITRGEHTQSPGPQSRDDWLRKRSWKDKADFSNSIRRVFELAVQGHLPFIIVIKSAWVAFPCNFYC